jgi:hypothetical protein
MPWGSPEEIERRNRIRIAVWAYAYEIMDDTLVSDAEFDALALKIDPTVSTGNRKLDRFFRAEFSPATGMWVRKHPDQRGLHRTYLRIKALRKEAPC